MADMNDVEEVKTRLNLTPSQRKAVFLALLRLMQGSTLPKGSHGVVAENFALSEQHCSRLWCFLRKKLLSTKNLPPDTIMSQTDMYEATLLAPPDFFHCGRKGKSGRRVLIDREAFASELRTLPQDSRSNQRTVAAQLGVSQTHVGNMIKDGDLQVKKGHVKPYLTQRHFDTRLQFCLDQIDPSSLQGTRSGPRYRDMYDTVHVDEKWFNMKRIHRKVLCAPGEEVENTFTKHKSHIEKIMFIAAVGRPQFVEETGEWWDGKIGMWPCGHWGVYPRGGSVHKKGEEKWIDESVDAAKYRQLMLDDILPAVLAKHPHVALGKTVRIQQDSAGGHGRLRTDGNWNTVMEEMGFGESIELYNQPSQSPDTNLLDLGFFNAIQSAYWRKCPRTHRDLLRCVQEAHEELDSNKKINRMWLTLMSCYNEIIENDGTNAYKIPHMSKAKLEREGTLPEVLPVTRVALPLLEDLGYL